LPALPRTIDRGGVQQKQRACVGDAIVDHNAAVVTVHSLGSVVAYHCPSHTAYAFAPVDQTLSPNRVNLSRSTWWCIGW